MLGILMWLLLMFVLYYFFFSTFKPGPCEDPKPEAEVKWTTVGWK